MLTNFRSMFHQIEIGKMWTIKYFGGAVHAQIFIILLDLRTCGMLNILLIFCVFFVRILDDKLEISGTRRFE